MDADDGQDAMDPSVGHDELFQSLVKACRSGLGEFSSLIHDLPDGERFPFLYKSFSRLCTDAGENTLESFTILIEYLDTLRSEIDILRTAISTDKTEVCSVTIQISSVIYSRFVGFGPNRDQDSSGSRP